MGTELDEAMASWREIMRAYIDAVDAKVNILKDWHEATVHRFDTELADIRDGFVDIDHKLARVRATVADHEERLTA